MSKLRDVGHGYVSFRSAWLIEYPWPTNPPRPGPEWWTGGFVDGSHEWTKDPDRAARFARKEDAEAVMRGGAFSHNCVATEHEWL